MTWLQRREMIVVIRRRSPDLTVENCTMIRSACIMGCLLVVLFAGWACTRRVVSEPRDLSDYQRKTDVEGDRYHPKVR